MPETSSRSSLSLQRFISKLSLKAALAVYATGVAVPALVYFKLERCSFGRSVGGMAESFYFSVVTITTLGYGDITPTETLSKLLVAIQSIFGIFMVGVVLSVLISDVEKQKKRRFGRLNALASRAFRVKLWQESWKIFIFFEIDYPSFRRKHTPPDWNDFTEIWELPPEDYDTPNPEYTMFYKDLINHGWVKEANGYGGYQHANVPYALKAIAAILNALEDTEKMKIILLVCRSEDHFLELAENLEMRLTGLRNFLLSSEFKDSLRIDPETNWANESVKEQAYERSRRIADEKSKKWEERFFRPTILAITGILTELHAIAPIPEAEYNYGWLE